MITQEHLKQAGYKPFNQVSINRLTNFFWQKRFDDEKGIKYFITIFEYDNTRLDIHSDYIIGEYSFEPESQFESYGITFDIQMLSPESIEQVEDFFEKMWYNMNCSYYEEF